MSTETTMPPVRKTVTVAQPVEKAFALFTSRIAAWWPLATSADAPGVAANAATVVLEPRPGGRIYERMDDGTIAFWGEVLAIESPHRLVLAWQPNEDRPAPTEIEVRFTPEGSGTRVDLEHRGWERLGEGAASVRQEYDSVWDDVLRLYVAAGPDNGHAIASLVLGIASVAVPVLGLLAAPFGIVFGILGRRRSRKGARQGGFATAGLTLSVVGLVLWAAVVVGGLTIVSMSVQGSDESVPVNREPVEPVEPR